MRKSLVFYMILIFQSTLFAQNQFILSGKTKLFVAGKVIIFRESAPDAFYSSQIKQDTAIVNNSSFTFKGVISRPEFFRLKFLSSSNKGVLSEPFFIDSGFQQLSVSSDYPVNDAFDVGFGVMMKGSKTTDEYFKVYFPLFTNVLKQYAAYDEEREECFTTKDTLLRKALARKIEPDRQKYMDSRGTVMLGYATKKPQSPIIPWILDQEIHYYGYNEFYSKILAVISPYITPAMRDSLQGKLTFEKRKAVGNHFILTDFIDASLSRKISQNKYTLIDFWFSDCGPCLAQFEKLRPIYAKYNGKGFEIVAVSIDQKETLPAYRTLLQARKYPWQQILDIGGQKTQELRINSYPSSFLLDSDGKIVKSSVNPAVLDIFLEGNL